MTFEEERKFVNYCEQVLPQYVTYGNFIYRLDAHGLLTDAYRISYGEYNTNGGFYNWDNKLFDRIYEIGELEINDIKKRPMFRPPTKKKSIIEIVEDALLELQKLDARELKNIKIGNDNSVEMTDFKPTFPLDAHSFEVFAIKPSEDSPTGKQVFIGYKLRNGDFHFVSVPFTEPSI